jgi:hypothetical protein
MTTPTAENIYFARARLIKSPSTTAGDPPYGGTYLGIARDITVAVTHRGYWVRYEEYGGIRGRMLEGLDEVDVSAMMRGSDADAITWAWGAASIAETVTTPIAYAESRAAALLIAPIDVAQRAVYLPRAIMAPAERTDMAYSLAREFGWRAQWCALPDASGRIWIHDTMESITL